MHVLCIRQLVSFFKELAAARLNRTGELARRTLSDQLVTAWHKRIS
jgi:hypothetical protein